MSLKFNLRKLRGAVKQKEIAEKIGISYANYNKYETTDTIPDVDTLFKIADYYRISVDELLGHNIPYKFNRIDFTDKQLELIEKIKNLSDRQCEKTEAFVVGLESAGEEK